MGTLHRLSALLVLVVVAACGGGEGQGLSGLPSDGGPGSGSDVSGSADTDAPSPGASGATEPSESPGTVPRGTDATTPSDTEGLSCPVDAQMRRCYTGPAETRNVGMCRDGFQTCRDGIWGPCEGEVLPTAEVCNGRDNSCNGIVDDGVRNACGECGPEPEEICGNGLDDNCNGIVDDGCDCDGRTNQPCYSGPPGTLGLGQCRGGVMDCIDGVWGPCIGEVLPSEEVCDGRDNNCNGIIDDGVRNACGECRGTEPEEVCDGQDTNCNGIVDDGLRVQPCDRCPDDISPVEICGTGLDDNCSGIVDEGCGCGGLSEQQCYPGDPARAGVGACAWGRQLCQQGGEAWGPCIGYVLPAPFEICDGQDTNCDGEIDEGCTCTPEVCDGQDNNCSGYADDGLRCTNPDSPAFGRCFEEVASEPQMQADMERDPTSWIHLCPSGNCCDGLDNDCNGLIDEGLLNACGNCDDWCYEETWDRPARWAEGERTSLSDDLSQGLTLGEGRVQTVDLWIANSDGTVTRINTDDVVVTATYPTHGIQPSRTAVDEDGNVWVANRALGDELQGSVIRIGVDCPCTGNCATGDQALPPNRPWLDALSTQPNPAFNPDDPCIVGPIDVGQLGGWVRGLAMDLDGYIWAGTHNTNAGRHRLYRVDPTSFEVQVFETPVRIYGLAVDQAGLMWIAAQDPGHGIGCFDTRTLQPCTINGEPAAQFRTQNTQVTTHGGASDEIRTYGIAVDQAGDIWLGNWTANSMIRFHRDAFEAGQPRVDIYGPGAGQPGTTPTGSGNSRGIAIDGEGFIYMVWSSGDRLSKFDPRTGEWIWSAETCRQPAGVGIAGDGNVWVMCLSGSRDAVVVPQPVAGGRSVPGPGGTETHYGPCGRLPGENDWAASAEQFDPDGNCLASLPTGPNPYSYSDLTGFQLFNVVAPRGSWRAVFDCGRPDCVFDELLWDASVPTGALVTGRVRSRTAPDAPWSDWTDRGDASPMDLRGRVPDGQQAEVELQLEAGPNRASPTVTRVDVRWQRP